MGFSFSVGFAVLGVTVFIIAEILMGAVLPSISGFTESWGETKDRRMDEVQSQINITLVVEGVSGSWWNNSFLFRKPIIINNEKVLDIVEDFPVLIDITDNDLKFHVQQTNGNDIAFVSEDHSTKLNHQIELYDYTTGHLVAWVLLETIDPIDTTIFYMYYGNTTCANQQNSSGVWNSNFHGVWHFNDSSDRINDSTSYYNDGEAYNTPSYNVAGKIAGAMQFKEAQKEYVLCGDPADGSLDFGTGDFTIECWVKTTTTYDRFIVAKLEDSQMPTYGFSVGIKNKRLWAQIADGDFGAYDLGRGPTDINDGEWHYVVVSFDRDNEAIYYVDGQGEKIVDISSYTDSVSSDDDFRFCRHQWMAGKYDYFDGTLDEARVSTCVRSEVWINASYENQNNPSDFYTVYKQGTTLTTIMVKNTGSITLNSDDFDILFNGIKYNNSYNRSFLFPLKDVLFYIDVSMVVLDPPYIKVVSETGAEDTYIYYG